ncbi:MAG TPA: hypothetical protein PLR91_11640 [Kiritimatiellia bacterium]|nr:hypothetical protein [Kiritimatiellia bacterium]
MTAFLWRSLFRAYGWRFLWHVPLPHPLRTLRTVTVAGRLPCEGDSVDVPGPMRNGGPLRRLVAFESGDCRDYRTWVRADVGLKEEQTGLPQAARAGGVADERRVEVRAEKRGSVYLSRYEGTLNVQRSMLNSQGVQNFSVES